MKTYSCHYTSGEALFEKKPASEVFNLMPAGAKIIVGDVNGKPMATFELPNGMKIILKEDK